MSWLLQWQHNQHTDKKPLYLVTYYVQPTYEFILGHNNYIASYYVYNLQLSAELTAGLVKPFLTFSQANHTKHEP